MSTDHRIQFCITERTYVQLHVIARDQGRAAGHDLGLIVDEILADLPTPPPPTPDPHVLCPCCGGGCRRTWTWRGKRRCGCTALR